MKLAIVSLVALALLSLNACGPAVPRPGPQSGIVGKWRSADGSYRVEFLATGNCTAFYRMQGRDLGGPCTYTVDQDDIVLHYNGPGMTPATATWYYSLDGDVLNVSVFGNSMKLQRTP